MKFRHSVLLCSLFSLQEFAEGFRLSLHGNVGRSSNLRRRDNLFGTTSLADSSDIQYNTNLSLNGQNYQVSIDTGRWRAIFNVNARAWHLHSTLSDLQLGFMGGRHSEQRSRHGEDIIGHLCWRRSPRHVDRCLFSTRSNSIMVSFLGVVKTAQLEFAGFSINNQAYRRSYCTAIVTQHI